ncbi:MAG: EF-hand domain-containing protein [Planctomycetaceae bacterium]|nr:EF-hand domain-containing protein [Planctomycetaceae bacterium]
MMSLGTIRKASPGNLPVGVVVCVMGLIPTFAPADELFQTLDRNRDGVIERSEVADGQLPYFERALRVADQNEDGALQQSELDAAVTDQPARQVTPGQRGRFGSPGGFDVQQMDRNRDGRITIDEVPQPLKDRFQQALDRAGVAAIPVEALREFLQNSGRPRQIPGAARPEPSGTEMQTPQSPRQRQRSQVIRELIGRVDADGDRQISQEEQERFPAITKMLDTNQDGRISPEEIRKALNGDDTEPMDRRSPGDDSPEIRPGTRNRSATSAQMFERFDQNKDGKLSADEVPERVRSVLRRADTNGDGTLNKDEWDRVSERFER